MNKGDFSRRFFWISLCSVAFIMIFSFLIPIAKVFFSRDFGFFFGNFINLDSIRNLAKVAFYTLKVAFCSTVIAFVVGICVAFFATKRDFLFKKWILALSAVPLCVPSLIIALGFVSFWGMGGFVNSFFVEKLGFEEVPFKFLYSFWGIVIAQGFYNFPFVTGIIYKAWKILPLEQENAARLLGANEVRVFFSITLKQLSGAIGSALIPVFLFCFFSFMFVLLFCPPGMSVFEVEIYHLVKSTFDYKSASFLAFVETCLAVCIVFIYLGVCKKYVQTTQGFDFCGNQKKLYSIGKSAFCKKFLCVIEIVFFVVLILLVLLFFVFPLCCIFISAFTKRERGDLSFSVFQFKTLFSSPNFWKAFFNSIWIGICSGFLCCFCGFVYSCILKFSKNANRFLWQIIPLLPMAISSVVIGWGMSLVFRRGNAFLLILMQVAIYWPIAFRQIQNGINKIPTETLLASKILSKDDLDTVFRIFLPSCKKFLWAAFCCSFAISLGDTTLPLVLSVQGLDTLALYTYRLAGSYRFELACASGTIMALLSILLYSIGEKNNDE